MPVVVSLQDVVEAMDMAMDETETLLDPDTGEIITVTEDDRAALDDPDPDSLPEWQRQDLPKLRAIVESDRSLRLPDSFEIHEWEIMKRFCGSVDDPEARDELFEAIHGKGAFRMFRRTAERLNRLDQWHQYRQQALEQIARDWLDAHGIPCKSMP